MFFKTINKIKNAYHHNRLYTKVSLKKKEFKLIKIFIKLGIIKNVVFFNNIFYVTYSYSNNSSKKKFLIINMHRPSNKKFIKLKTLKNLTLNKNWILLLSTNKGVITSLEAVSLKVGGLIIAKIFN